MRVLGLDMSSRKSGYSLFNNDKLIDYGCWERKKEVGDWRDNILFMSINLGEYIKNNKIDKIYCEDVPPIIQNSQTVKVLSALQGCVIGMCHVNNIDIEFVPVGTWKNKVGIDISHCKEYQAMKRIHKGDKSLSKLKDNVKAYEKKMSVDYANYTHGIDLVYKSKTSKDNQDDIADSINIVTSKLDCMVKYNIEDVQDIMDKLWEQSSKGILKSHRKG